ncbi:MAG: UDP-N-acetylmuramate dehydrogenase [Bacteroidales bacterium]
MKTKGKEKPAEFSDLPIFTPQLNQETLPLGSDQPGQPEVMVRNTFGLPVRAIRLLRIGSQDDFHKLQSLHEEGSKPLLFLGEGSNILFTRDFNGTIVQAGFDGIEVLESKQDRFLIRVGAAWNWDRWVAYALDHGWYGLENLSLIPGTVGAAPVQNIGAYGTALEDHLAWVEAWDTQTGRLERFSREECNLGYRSSRFKHQPERFFISHVVFSLSEKPRLNTAYGNLKEELARLGGRTPADLRNLIIQTRKQKLPDPVEFGNAGSFFKNPVVDEIVYKCLRAEFGDVPHYPVPAARMKIPAAWLIDKAGLRGKREGQVGTWPGQPLVLVNHGGATGEQIGNFARTVQEKVGSLFGIELEPEVRIL